MREIKITINESTSELLETIHQVAIASNIGEENITEKNNLTDSKLLELVLSIGIESLLYGKYDLIFDEEKEKWVFE